MELILYFIAKLISVSMEVASLAMVVRALLPLLIEPEDSKLYMLSYIITEPFIIPVRYILAKLNKFQDSPFDFAFLFTYLILSLIQLFLPVI